MGRMSIKQDGILIDGKSYNTTVIERMILSIQSASDTLERTAHDKTDVQTSWKTLSIERTHSVRVTRDCGLGQGCQSFESEE